MGEIAEMMLDGTLCEGCGCFIDAEPQGFPGRCDDCFEEELIQAVEEDVWPDGITHSEWVHIKRKYSEAEHAYRE